MGDPGYYGLYLKFHADFYPTWEIQEELLWVITPSLLPLHGGSSENWGSLHPHFYFYMADPVRIRGRSNVTSPPTRRNQE